MALVFVCGTAGIQKRTAEGESKFSATDCNPGRWNQSPPRSRVNAAGNQTKGCTTVCNLGVQGLSVLEKPDDIVNPNSGFLDERMSSPSLGKSSDVLTILGCADPIYA